MARWLWLMAAASLLALFLAPAIVAAVGSNTGYIEVCKDSDGSGASGTFRFTVGPQTVAVPVGACSAPLELPVGPVIVTEEAVAGVGVTSIAVSPADRELTTSLPTRSAQVNVVPGGIANQTLVTFMNRSEMGLLSVCKAAGTGIVLGTNFTFMVAGRAIAVPAGACASAGSFPFGSIVTVTEVLEATTRVSDIGVIPPNRMVGAPNLTDGTVSVSIGMLVTQVTFTNEAVAQGSVQICKRSDATNVTGAFTFTVAGQRVDVPVGGCSSVLQVPEGIVTVSEVPRGDAVVTGITVTPATRSVEKDLAEGTAHVRVVGGSPVVTTVTFTNQLQTGQVKVCKVAGAGVTLGAPFRFDVGDRAVTVPAGSCALAGAFPINSFVRVAEAVPAGMRVMAIGVAPEERLSGVVSLAGGAVTVVVGQGVTEVTFTNQSVTTTTLPSTTSTVPTFASTTVTSTIPPLPTTTVPTPTTTTAPMSTTTTVPFVGPTTTVPVSTTTTVPFVGPTTTIPTLLVTSTTSAPATTSTTSGVLFNTSTTLPSVASTSTTALPGASTSTTVSHAGTSTTAVPFASTSTTVNPATTSTTSNVVSVTSTVAPPVATSTTLPRASDTNPSTTTTSLPCIPPSTTPSMSSPSTIPPGMELCIETATLSTPTTIVGRLVETVTVPLTTARLALTGSTTSLLLMVAFAALVVGVAILLLPSWAAAARAGRQTYIDSDVGAAMLDPILIGAPSDPEHVAGDDTSSDVPSHLHGGDRQPTDVIGLPWPPRPPSFRPGLDVRRC